ncbi:MAG: TetR/AcrR family transcriptional regulator [Deltaproteobacteria bacterium]|nr:TetR/AcrR family transcriptional regulator [Deltaproteobacteria bacterium]
MATKGERTRDHILDEASRLIQRKGIAATSIGEILSAAGVHKGSLYFHFRDKGEIGREVIRKAADRFMAFVDGSLTGATSRIALENFFDAVLNYHRSAGFVGGCLFGNTALESCDSAPEMAALVDGVFVAWTDRISRVIAGGQQAGDFRDDIAAHDLARQVVATLEGGIMLSRLRKKAAPLESCIETLKVFLRPAIAMGSGHKQQFQ